MADKTKSIKAATDKELDELIFRLRKEAEVQSLISDIKRKSGSGYMPYDYGQEISTEKPIETLYHFGVPGMRWGKRKVRTTIGSLSKRTRQSTENDSEDHKRKNELKKKPIKEMSNAELKVINERLQLERQYKDLSKNETNKGKNFVNKILQTSGTTVATTVATAAGMYFVKKAIGKKFGDNVLKDIFPKKK
jgi:hypothetical protein